MAGTGTTVDNVAKYDGISWTNLENGISDFSGEIRAIVIVATHEDDISSPPNFIHCKKSFLCNLLAKYFIVVMVGGGSLVLILLSALIYAKVRTGKRSKYVPIPSLTPHKKLDIAGNHSSALFA